MSNTENNNNLIPENNSEETPLILQHISQKYQDKEDTNTKENDE